MKLTKNKSLLLLIAILLINGTLLKAQDLLGLTSGNYAGIAGVAQNPASIVDNRYKFDINIIGISSAFTNNYFSVKKDAIIKGSFFKSPYNNSFDAVRKDLLSVNTLDAGEKVYANINTRVQMPLSFMVSVGKKSAIALNIESRTGIQLNNISQELAKMGYENFKYAPYYGQTFNADGFSMNAISWASAGLTYGTVLLDNKNHFIKAAFTGKYVGGVASLYNNYDQLQYTFIDSGNLVLNHADAKYGHSVRTDFDKFKNFSDFRPEAEGFGFDAGIVYEYRGRINNFLYSENDDVKQRRDKNKYTFRLSAAIVDVGKLSFDKAEFARNFTANEPLSSFNFKQINASSVNDVDTAIAQRVLYTENKGAKYDVALPTALNVNFDLHLFKGFYVNLGTFQPLKLNKDAESRIDAKANYSVIPRWESRAFGVYVPFTYNEYKDLQLGATLRVGPLYLGSANLGTVLFNSKVKNADIHVGLHIPIAYGKPSKLSKLLNKSTENNSTTIVRDSTVSIQRSVVTQTPSPQPITIIINNYNGGPVPQSQTIYSSDTTNTVKDAVVKKDTVIIQQQRTAVVDTVVINKNTNISPEEKEVIVTTDKIDQAKLDYLINKMAAQEVKIKQLEEELKKKDNKAKLASTTTDNAAIERELIKIKAELTEMQKQPSNVYNTYNSSTPNTQPSTVVVNPTTTVAPVIIKDTVISTRTIKDTVYVNVPPKSDTVYLQKKAEKIIVNTTTDYTVDKLLDMNLEKVLFNVGQSTINPMYYKNLDFVAKQMQTYNELKIQLDGYTDAVGNKDQNILLSQKRSQAVKNYLIKKGTASEKIIINFHGPDMPIADNKTIDGKLMNRRVELSFIK